MSLACGAVRERLADGESAPEITEHLEGCAECAAIARALADVDLGLAALPAIEPGEGLIAATIARATGERAEREPARPAPPEPIGAPSLLAASLGVIVSALGALLSAPLTIARWMIASTRGRWTFGRWTFALGSGLAACAALLTMVTYRSEAPSIDSGILARGLGGDEEASARVQVDGARVDLATAGGSESTNGIDDATLEEGRYRLRFSTATTGEDHADEGDLMIAGATTTADVELDRQAELEDVRLEDALDLPPDLAADRAAVDRDGEGDDGRDVSGLFEANVERDLGGEVLIPRAPELRGRVSVETAPVAGSFQRGEAAGADTWAESSTTREPTSTPALAPRGATTPEPEEPRDLRDEEERTGATRPSGAADRQGGQTQRDPDALGWRLSEHAARPGDPPAGRAPEPRSWNDSERTEGLSIRARDGWWATTYVPGDPAIRALHARLASADQARLGDRSPLALAETASPLAPAIEAPADRALALGVQADVAAVEGPTRVRVEVDLRGIRQAAGRRAPMRIAVVIDARHALGDAEEARLRALLRSLGRAAGARDRIAVLAAGEHGGALVPLGTLRHGELEVALRRLLAGEGGAPSAIDRTIAEAALAVASPDDVGLVLLATPDAAHDGALDLALHRAAVAGVPTSVVALGEGARAADLDAIAIAGQGRRRIVRAPSDADAVARAEIEAASQLVARALRLRVRLAPGVQLVDVLGSRPLEAPEVTRTREAERAIDRDLAQRLGIQSDRDEDDEGIRIFVPAFYADDAHAVVLDLLVPGPGAIAEVDVRYKDLVRLENGVASGALSLPRGAPSRGPGELRVVASRLAHETAQALAEAGDRAQAGDPVAARTRLLEMRAAIEAARAALPRLARDRSVAALATLCDRYAAALAIGSDAALVADSARYASHRLLLRPRLAAGD